MGTIDNTARQTLGVITVPNGINGFTLISTGSVPAGNRLGASITTIPDSSQLSLWNFLFTIVVDSLAQDSDGEFLYAIPYGSGFVSQDPKANCVIQQWIDWGRSSDTTNRRCHIIRIENNDVSPHTYYLLYKGYSWTNKAGIS